MGLRTLQDNRCYDLFLFLLLKRTAICCYDYFLSSLMLGVFFIFYMTMGLGLWIFRYFNFASVIYTCDVYHFLGKTQLYGVNTTNLVFLIFKTNDTFIKFL